MKKSKKTRKMTWIIILAIFLLGGLGYGTYRYYYMPSQQESEDRPSLQTAAARRGDIVLYASGSGNLIPAAKVVVGFDVRDGVREELLALEVEVGDHVEDGQVLARMDDGELNEVFVDARRELRELTSPAAYAQAEKELAQAKIDLEDAVGDLMWLISPSVYRAEQYLEQYTRELAEAQTAWEESPSPETENSVKEAEQNLNWAEMNYRNQLAYYEKVYLPENFTAYYWKDKQKIEYLDSPTEAEIEMLRVEIDGYEARIAELEVLLDAMRGEEIPEEATGSRLAAMRRAQKAVEDALQDLEAATLTAPRGGTVTAIYAEESQKVGNETLMTIVELSPPTLEAFFDESDWQSVQEGYPAEVVFDALPEKTFAGEVTHVDPELAKEGNTAVVRVLVTLETADTGWNDLPLGSAASVDVIGGRAEDAVLVPVEAVREISEGEYAVFKVVNGTPRMQMVEVGLQDLIFAEIISGLEKGDVVTTGQVETE